MPQPIEVSQYNETEIAIMLSSHVNNKFQVNSTFEVERDYVNQGYTISIVMENEAVIFDSPTFDIFITKVRSLFVKKFAGLLVQYKSIEDSR
jgi:uncharacterized membrane protein